MDPKTILKTLKDASPLDLFLVSFLLLPFVFDAWVGVLEKLEFGICAKYWSLGIVLVGYIVGVVAMLVGSNRQREREIARDQVIQYLTANNYKMVSFERIRININQAYSDSILETLPVHFPNQLRKAILKGGTPGLARITESEIENEA
ncbi:MAG: hypothetical protein KAU06_00075 [Candidatus Marinimicrobia bacterium]|nr:hypothetical protein [Candidatus Neomarinimicrobiota bacterium]